MTVRFDSIYGVGFSFFLITLIAPSLSGCTRNAPGSSGSTSQLTTVDTESLDQVLAKSFGPSVGWNSTYGAESLASRAVFDLGVGTAPAPITALSCQFGRRGQLDSGKSLIATITSTSATISLEPLASETTESEGRYQIQCTATLEDRSSVQSSVQDFYIHPTLNDSELCDEWSDISDEQILNWARNNEEHPLQDWGQFGDSTDLNGPVYKIAFTLPKSIRRLGEGLQGRANADTDKYAGNPGDGFFKLEENFETNPFVSLRKSFKKIEVKGDEYLVIRRKYPSRFGSASCDFGTIVKEFNPVLNTSAAQNFWFFDVFAETSKERRGVPGVKAIVLNPRGEAVALNENGEALRFIESAFSTLFDQSFFGVGHAIASPKSYKAGKVYFLYDTAAPQTYVDYDQGADGTIVSAAKVAMGDDELTITDDD